MLSTNKFYKALNVVYKVLYYQVINGTKYSMLQTQGHKGTVELAKCRIYKYTNFLANINVDYTAKNGLNN